MTRPAGRARTVRNLAGRLELGQEVFQISRVGTSRAWSNRVMSGGLLIPQVVSDPGPTGAAGNDLTRENL